MSSTSRERISPTDPRPTKKTRPPDPAIGQPHPMLRVNSRPHGNGVNGTPMVSWKDKVLNREKAKELAYDAKERTPVDLIAAGLITRDYKEGNTNFPRFHVDPKYMEALEIPWKQSVVVKLLGRTITFRVLYSKIEQLWRPAGGFDVLDLGHDYFLVKFDHSADFDRAMEGGPWLMFDHYLSVRPWTPSFSAVHATVDCTLVWVRFPEISVQYYDEDLLMALATGIGRPVKVDKNTTLANRGRFARVCVEIDLDKPLVGQVEIDGVIYYVEYEGLHTICFKCGKYGHREHTCPITLAMAAAQEADAAAPAPADVTPQRMETERERPGEQKDGDNNGSHLGLGAWMVVQKKPRKSSRARPADFSVLNQRQSQNRYTVLNEDDLVANEQQAFAGLGHETDDPAGFTFDMGSGSGVKKTSRSTKRQEVPIRPKSALGAGFRNISKAPAAVPGGEVRIERELGTSTEATGKQTVAINRVSSQTHIPEQTNNL